MIIQRLTYTCYGSYSLPRSNQYLLTNLIGLDEGMHSWKEGFLSLSPSTKTSNPWANASRP